MSKVKFGLVMDGFSDIVLELCSNAKHGRVDGNSTNEVLAQVFEAFVCWFYK